MPVTSESCRPGDAEADAPLKESEGEVLTALLEMRAPEFEGDVGMVLEASQKDKLAQNSSPWWDFFSPPPPPRRPRVTADRIPSEGLLHRQP